MTGKAWAVAVVAAVAGLAVGAWFAGQRDEPNVEQIKEALQQDAAAWNRGDLDGFMKSYWNDPAFTFFSDDQVTKGYDALHERYRKRYQAEGKEMGKLTFSELDVKPMGEGWVLVRGRWKVEKKAETSGGLFTLVMRQTPEGWRTVHDHTSAAVKK